VHRDPRSADRLIARLGHLLRLSLDQAAGHQMVPLRQELEFLRAYLEIEQTRFRDRLAVEIDVGPEVLDAAVPTLLLQPLVENAIRHGVAPRPAGGRVSFRAVRHGDQLTIEVDDDGPGFPSSPAGFAEGLGIRNTRERLRQLFGAGHGLRFENIPGSGARVSIELPFLECHQANTPLHLRATPRLATLSA
jgi:LytS/YehU family sensor histidine kinase